METEKEERLRIFEKYLKYVIDEENIFEVDTKGVRAALTSDVTLLEIVVRNEQIMEIIRGHRVRLEVLVNNMLEEIEKSQNKKGRKYDMTYIGEETMKGINFNPR